MTVPAPPTVGTAPSPAPTTTDTINFDARADAFHQFFPNWLNVLFPAVLQWIKDRTTELFANTHAATAAAQRVDAIAASSAVQNAAANAAAAQLAATQAQAYAAQAQATNPDSPIRLNPKAIKANLTIPAGYNAASVGPIAICDGVTVTVSDHTTWSIN
jgi:hypothetical protein